MADREAIFDYIEAENPSAAITVDNRISARSRILIAFPNSGRPGRVDGTRDLVVGQTPFVIAYRIAEDTVNAPVHLPTPYHRFTQDGVAEPPFRD